MTTSSKLRKCKGCGIELSLNKNELGYVPKLDKDTKYCYRCFRLKHYNENIQNKAVETKVQDTVDKLDLENKNVFLIVDILDLYGSKISLEQNYQKLFLIINKMDLFKNNHNIEKIQSLIIENIKYLNYEYNEIFFVSALSTNSIKKLNYFIKHLPKNSKNIFIGKTNVGKSSLINSLLKVNKLDANLTTNNALNTTINLQKIKLDHQFIIDTPGVNDHKNLLSWIDDTNNSELSFSKKNVNTKTFQIKYNKRIMIENLIAIDVYLKNDEPGSVSFYSNKNLKLISKNISEEIFTQKNKINYKQGIDAKIVTHQYNFKNMKNNITISGLGLISFKNIEAIKIHILDEVGVYEWKYPII